jgi:hypothetical protein
MTEPTVIRLADKVDDVRYDNVQETLRYVLESLEPGGRYEKDGYRPTKVIVVMVDEHDEMYHIKSRPSQMKTSEGVALLELAKHAEIHSMFTDI